MTISNTTNKPKAAWRVPLASFAGTSIDWYDYYIFGLLPATGVFSRLYFPEQDPATASKKTPKEFTK